MTITAQIIADSVAENGKRITTFQLRYPRFIHAEFMTHRMFSRNASSSRAIPVERLIADVMNDTAMPIHWGKNQKGMQAQEENDALVAFPSIHDCEEPSAHSAAEAWFEARDRAIGMARAFDEAGYHKQIVNRLLEPFSHINVVVTATEWSNFFALRDHPDAQPEIRELAIQMKAAMEASTPEYLWAGDWHLPYITREELEAQDYDVLIKISVARCARVSYLTHEGKQTSIEADIELYNRLVGNHPIHASPAEHQAIPLQDANESSGNFRGWLQYRKTLSGECL